MSLESLLNQTVSLYPLTGYDEFAREQVGIPVNYQARFEPVLKDKLLPGGQKITITGLAFISGDITVALNDRLDYGGEKYKVFSKKVAIDGQGNAHHTKLELLDWNL